jgi:hypothetical protein
MPITSNSSPLAEALARVVEIFSPGAFSRKLPRNERTRLILSYRDPNDFGFLWRFWRQQDQDDAHLAKGSVPDGEIIIWTQSEAEADEGSKDLIIIWDGSPSPSLVGNVRLANYVTPYDWIVAFILALKSHGLQPNPKLRIRIIDLTSYQSGGCESSLLFHQLQLGSTSGLDCRISCPAAKANGETPISEILREILATGAPETKQTTPTELGVDWRLLKRLWAARLFAPSDARDRHAIANLVGPQLLISSMASSTMPFLSSGSPCLIALIALMRVLGLLPSNREYVSSPWVDPAKFEASEFGTANAPAFVLIDDMYNLGWATFLRLALGITIGEGKPTFIASDSPTGKAFGSQGASSLVDQLEEAGQLRLNRGMELVPGRDTVLFLDLRLFSERTSFEEAEFISSLLVLARQAREDGVRNDLPWVGFSTLEIQAVENFLASGKVDGDDYLVALTLLPRLIALVDPRLPIVLFSSTGQRRVAEALREYPSIITNFDKPRFFGDASVEIVQETRVRFELAIMRALSLLRGRAVCRRLREGAVSDHHNAKARYAEIYFDEGDTVAESTFRVAGLVVFGDDETQVAQFNESMVEQGLVWGSTDIAPWPATSLLSKRMKTNYEFKIFEPVGRLGKVAGLEPAIAFSLKVSPTLEWRDSNDLTNPACLDNLYRSLVLQTLETLLFEVLPARMKQENPHFRCGIFLANRTRYESPGDASADWDQDDQLSLARRYGVKIKLDEAENKFYFNSVRSDAVYPIVSQVLALMPEADIKVVSARGSKLFYRREDRYPESLPRPAHLLADLAVRFSKEPDLLWQHPSLERWFDNGFIATADEQFVSILEACRLARAGMHVEAVLEAHKALTVSPNKRPLEWWARPRIARSVDSLSGPDFTELCSRLPPGFKANA